MALKWFEPDLLSSSNPRSCPLWMDDWTEFVIKLQSTFGPHNPVTDAKNQLDHLQMKENQCINKYVDKICRIGKPCNLDNLCYLAQRSMHVTGSVRRKFSVQINLPVPTTSLSTNPVVLPLILARASPLPPPMPTPLQGMLIPCHPTSLSLAMVIPILLESWARMAS
ncbi:hypothetical protein ID866_12597 [Astraeus odoratus]|nr:hypothetical protein ID866_12597 [Astraeus odoratus]